MVFAILLNHTPFDPILNIRRNHPEAHSMSSESLNPKSWISPIQITLNFKGLQLITRGYIYKPNIFHFLNLEVFFENNTISVWFFRHMDI